LRYRKWKGKDDNRQEKTGGNRELPGLNAGIVGFDAAYGTVVCGRASLALAMPRHFGSVSERSAVPGIVVLRKTPDNVPQFVKQYRNMRLRSVSGVGRDHRQTIVAGLK